MVKHGIENFKIEIIENCNSIEEMNEKESFWIDYYDSCNRENGYNLHSGGDNHIPNEATRKKMSEARKGRKLTKEQIEKTRQANLGRKLSLETRKKISESRKGKKTGRIMTEEHKRLLREGRNKYIPKPWTLEARQKMSILSKNRKPYVRTQEIRDKISNSVKKYFTNKNKNDTIS
jgi:hypothetical protein